MPQSETVIEISIEETNRLRQSLGLAPLRVNSSSKPSHDSSRNTNNNHTTSSVIPSSTPTTGENGKGSTATDEVLSLSVSQTNDLRKSLGLPPLREKKNIISSSEEEHVIGQRDDNIGRKSSLAIHKPAPNTHQQSILQERIERSKLEREVQEGIRKFEKKTGIVGLDQEQDGKNDKRGSMDNLSWADLMRKKATGLDLDKQTLTTAPMHGKNKSHDGNNANKYKDADMQEQNLIVSHNVSDFQEGTTAILTLKDQAILGAEGGSDGDDEAQVNLLENVDMAEQQVLQHNLKQKRLAQLGMGHAGGYTGYDDDEFMELGGNVKSHPSNSHRGVTGIGTDEHDRKVQGFQILGNQTQVETSKGHGGNHNSDLFASLEGKEISLESALTGSSRQQDFMTAEEEEEEEEERGFGNHSSVVSKEKLERKRKRREKKARKKLKKYQKDGTVDMDDDNSQTIQPDSSKVPSVSLLEELEASSKNRNSKKRARRMRRTNVESDESEGEEQLDKNKSNGTHLPNDASQVKTGDSHEVTALNQKREKYFRAVEKGNQRSRAMFDREHDTLDKPKSHPPAASEESVETMAVEDDAFLTAAISKARRLKRLRELHAKNALSSNVPLTDQNQAKGAKAVVEALQKWKTEGGENNGVHINTNSTGNVTFELGTTKEFTQALRAQSMIIAAQQDQHDDHHRSHVDTDQTLKSSSDQVVVPTDNDVLMEDANEQKPLNTHDTTATLEELAPQVQEDNILPNGDVFDSTGTTTGVGRGLSTFLGMLKKTGEIANKGKLAEELRGRAKDEKTYEDYAPLDLQNVVKIDDGIASKGGPFDKDIELANREVKLEYRDEHGRLLTRKEAYRQLCYQFHGHGSSKKKQEKRLQQIERERAELSSQNATDAGTLGALKATQKATGKAFVLHKT